MKDQKQFRKFAILWFSALAVSLLSLGIGFICVDVEWLAEISAVVCAIMIVIPVGITCYSLVYALLQFRKAYNAMRAGEDYEIYKERIHYTLPFAFPFGGIGFSLLSVLFAVIFAVIFYKWARHIYTWTEIKTVLLHRDNTSWGRTVLTWVNVLFFIFAVLIPLVIAGIIVGLIYLLAKLGVIDATFDMVINSMANSDSSSNSCSDCAHYGFYGDCKCMYGYSNPAGRCPHYTRQG